MAPLSTDEARLIAPLALPRAEHVSEPAPPDPEVVPAAAPALTPAEIRRRAAGYERWLKSQGLVRVEDVTVDANNPY